MTRQRYPVNEHFVTMQGEAHYTGTPSLFVRLQGCPVGCGWCDTKYTWDAPEARHEAHAKHIGSKIEPDGRFAWFTAPEIIGLIPDGIRHVVLTGGEPAMHNLIELTALIVNSRRRPQVETSATFPLFVHPETWVTVSPKLNMPGGLKVIPEVLKRADEVKFPVGKERDVQLLIDHVLPHVTGDCTIWLQPLSQSKRATSICFDAASRYGWRVSVQVHKYVGMQ